MGKLAVGSGRLAPLVVEGHKLSHFLGQEAVHGAATGSSVGQLAGGPAFGPPPGPSLVELELVTGGPKRPAGSDCVGQEIQQPRLGGLLDAAWDSATQPQRPEVKIPCRRDAKARWGVG